MKRDFIITLPREPVAAAQRKGTIMTAVTKCSAVAWPPRSQQQHIDKEVRCRIESCSYRFVFNKIRWHYEDRRLVLHGRVPSFYLKQVLQEMFKNIERVDCIENNVDVVSSNGLSSEPRKKPR